MITIRWSGVLLHGEISITTKYPQVRVCRPIDPNNEWVRCGSIEILGDTINREGLILRPSGTHVQTTGLNSHIVIKKRCLLIERLKYLTLYNFWEILLCNAAQRMSTCRDSYHLGLSEPLLSERLLYRLKVLERFRRSETPGGCCVDPTSAVWDDWATAFTNTYDDTGSDKVGHWGAEGAWAGCSWERGKRVRTHNRRIERRCRESQRWYGLTRHSDRVNVSVE